MTKVVHSRRFGGFGLSKKAVEWLIARGVVAKDKYDIERWHDRPRHDPMLVACVEALGEEASGQSAELVIAEVDGKYRIDEYDGYESVETPGSYEWVEP